MKKAITILLAAALMLSITACGGGNDSNNKPISGGSDTATTNNGNGVSTHPEEGTPEMQNLSLGDTVTTDFMEFTLDNAQLAVAIETDNFTPIEYSPEVKGYVAAKGHTFVLLDFTIKNLDRVNYLYATSNNSGATEHYLNFDVEYKDNTYTGFSSPATPEISVRYLMEKNADGSWEIMDNLTRHILEVDETKTIRCYFDIPVEVDSVSDTFKIKVVGTSDTFVITAPYSDAATE